MTTLKGMLAEKSFQERDPVRIAIVTTLALALVAAVLIRWNSLPLIAGGYQHTAYFADAGGLKEGDDVLVSGMTVGEVKKIALDGTQVRVDFEIPPEEVRLGSQSKAAIVTLTLLGRAGLQVTSAGDGNLGEAIPVARTSSPYELTSALADLTTTSGQIDTEALTAALDTVSGTLTGTEDQIKPALDGVTGVAQTIAGHDDQLRQLLDRASSVSELLSERNSDITTLLGSGGDLLQQLNANQQLIIALLHDATALSQQIETTIARLQKDTPPALKHLNKVVALLNNKKEQVDATIAGLYSYAYELGEAFSSGPFFDAYIQNLTAPSSLTPLLSEVLQ